MIGWIKYTVLFVSSDFGLKIFFVPDFVVMAHFNTHTL